MSHKYCLFYRELRSATFTLLDVGCGNHSPSLTKYWFPNSKYYGLDKSVYNNDPVDFDCMEQFYKIDLESSDLSEVPEGFFDVIIMSHVIEHIQNGLSVINKLTRKLSEKGKIYIEFPSIRSLSLPSARGTLNFCDDDSHVRIYDVKEVANSLLCNNIKIIKAGRRRNWLRIIMTPLTIPMQIYSLFRYGKLEAKWLIDVLGFADFVYGEKRYYSERLID